MERAPQVDSASGSPEWKRYPYVLSPSDPELQFPAAEGDQGAHTNTYYLAGRVRGVRSGSEWAYFVVFTFNAIRGWLRSDFYTFALFDLRNGTYGTYTENDFPRPFRRRTSWKLSVGRGHLHVVFRSELGPCEWITRQRPDGSLEPFAYRLFLRGRDARGQTMGLELIADPTKPPVAVGGAEYAGKKTCLGQPDTHSYFQSGVRVHGRLMWGDAWEEVTGDNGWIDRQWMPKHVGLHQGLRARRYRHEWRQLHLDNGVDLSVWLQVDRRNANRVIPYSGATASGPEGEPLATTEYELDRLTFVRDPGLVRPRFGLTGGPRYFTDSYRLRIPAWDLDVRSDPLVSAPAHAFPIEYWSGPTRLRGTMAGQPVGGFGFHERTLVFARDFELVDVLRDSVRHLAPEAFLAAWPGATVAGNVVWELDAFLSHGDRAGARDWLVTRVRPLLDGLRPAWRNDLLAIVADLDRVLGGR
jgi:hypothetical protein